MCADQQRYIRIQRRSANLLSRAGISTIANPKLVAATTLKAREKTISSVSKKHSKNQVTSYYLSSLRSGDLTPLHGVHVVRNFLSHSLCDLMVWESQLHQFESSRHRHFPTVDVPLRKMIKSYQKFHPLLQSTIYPYIKKLYKLRQAKFSVVDLFIVKYSTREQDHLKEHRDGSIISFNILLNQSSDFRGGGTKFSGIQGGLTLRNEKGGSIFHCGKLKHSGVKIVGRDSFRLILVGFLNVTSPSLVDEASRLKLRSLNSDDEYLRSLYLDKEPHLITKIPSSDKATVLTEEETTISGRKKVKSHTTSSGLLSCFRSRTTRKNFPQTLPSTLNP